MNCKISMRSNLAVSDDVKFFQFAVDLQSLSGTSKGFGWCFAKGGGAGRYFCPAFFCDFHEQHWHVISWNRLKKWHDECLQHSYYIWVWDIHMDHYRPISQTFHDQNRTAMAMLVETEKSVKFPPFALWETTTITSLYCNHCANSCSSKSYKNQWNLTFPNTLSGN